MSDFLLSLVMIRQKLKSLNFHRFVEVFLRLHKSQNNNFPNEHPKYGVDVSFGVLKRLVSINKMFSFFMMKEKICILITR